MTPEQQDEFETRFSLATGESVTLIKSCRKRNGYSQATIDSAYYWFKAGLDKGLLEGETHGENARG